MVKIKERFEFGNPEDLTQEKLVEQLKIMYTDLAQAINQKASVFERTTDGQTTDTFLSNGDININTSTLKVEMLVEHTDPSTVVWTQLS